MTYSQGSLIEAADYNGFVSNNSNANLNDVWATGSLDKGYGQTAVSTVSIGGTVSATQWASLVNNISTIASHNGTTITSRVAPVAGNTINILAALNTDLTNITTNRGNAVASGSQYGVFSGTTARTASTGSGSTPWTLTFTHTVTFASANAARWFFNAGGRIKIEFGKTSLGTEADDEWNDLANTLCGDLFFTGGTGTQTIAGTAYTGTTKVGGTGSPTTLSTTTGFFDLLTTDTELYLQYADTAPYTSNFIRVRARANASVGSATVITFTTTWFDPGGSAAGSTDVISGGTDTPSPATSITGTAPTTLVTYFPPSTTYLTNSWGTPTIAASVVAS